MTYKTLILDFDGTIADTEKSILQSMQYVADKFNLGKVNEELIKNLIGLPLKSTFEEVLSLTTAQMQEATFLYRKHYNENAIDTISLFHGVKETIKDLHDRGVELHVASSKGKESLIKILEKQNVLKYLVFVGGEEDAKNKKPAPDIVNLIINQYDYSPQDCLMVGDTIYDVEMGQRAFVATCGVTYGNNTKEQLQSQNPTYIIANFKELLEIV